MLEALLFAVTEAFDAGARVGALPIASAVDYPYPSNNSELRLSWMDGFSADRRRLAVDRRRSIDPATA